MLVNTSFTIPPDKAGIHDIGRYRTVPGAGSTWSRNNDCFFDECAGMF
jgi:hypothetical protein